jgi:hypothetical protein
MLIQFLGDYTIWMLILPSFRRQLLPPSSERKCVELASFCVYVFISNKQKGTRANNGTIAPSGPIGTGKAVQGENMVGDHSRKLVGEGFFGSLRSS